MTFNCKQCGEEIDVEISEFHELARRGRYDLDCGSKECRQSDIQRFTLRFSVTELAALVPTKKAGVTVGQQKLVDALGELGDFKADIYTRAESVLYDLRAQISTAITFRQAIAAALPATWYAAAPLEDRIQLLVAQWRKLHQRRPEIADALAALRAEWKSVERQYTFAYGKSSAAREIALRIADLDATITALGLPEPTAKDNQ